MRWVGLTTLGQPRLSEGAQPYPIQLRQHAALPLPLSLRAKLAQKWCSRWESNPNRRLRRPAFYPLKYESVKQVKSRELIFSQSFPNGPAGPSLFLRQNPVSEIEVVLPVFRIDIMLTRTHVVADGLPDRLADFRIFLRPQARQAKDMINGIGMHGS